VRKLHLALIAAAIAATALWPRPAAAQSDSTAGSIATIADASSGAGESGATNLTAEGQAGGGDQTSDNGVPARRGTPTPQIGAGLQPGPEDDGPIQKGSSEFELYASGGAAPTSVTKGDGVWDVGVRYGRVMTGPFLPGKMRGYLESAWDVMPLFVVTEP